MFDCGFFDCIDAVLDGLDSSGPKFPSDIDDGAPYTDDIGVQTNGSPKKISTSDVIDEDYVDAFYKGIEQSRKKIERNRKECEKYIKEEIAFIKQKYNLDLSINETLIHLTDEHIELFDGCLETDGQIFKIDYGKSTIEKKIVDKKSTVLEVEEVVNTLEGMLYAAIR